jgi:putative endonuclease
MAQTDPRRLVGALGEDLARRHLEARGFEVLDANFRTRHGELDVVVADDRCLVFCEVKTRVAARRSARECCAPASGPRGDGRDDDLGPFASIGVRKRQQVRQMAREWLALRGREAPWREEVRFDAIGIEFDPRGRLMRLDHLEGAF